MILTVVRPRRPDMRIMIQRGPVILVWAKDSSHVVEQRPCYLTSNDILHEFPAENSVSTAFNDSYVIRRLGHSLVRFHYSRFESVFEVFVNISNVYSVRKHSAPCDALDVV